LFLKGSKIDQFGKEATIQIPFNPETSLFTHIQQYLTIRPPAQGPFCCHLDGKSLTSYQFTAITHKSIKFIGIGTSTYKSHSFRIGKDTHLYLSGVPEGDIMSKGRWKSDAMKCYIRV
jgi:hypothetical protein